MEELLKKIEKYAVYRGVKSLTLQIETDESGQLCTNPWDRLSNKTLFEFDNLIELINELEKAI